jgi:hypothetical protein
VLAGPQIRRLRERQAVLVLFVKAVSGVYAADYSVLMSMHRTLALSDNAEHSEIHPRTVVFGGFRSAFVTDAYYRPWPVA